MKQGNYPVAMGALANMAAVNKDMANAYSNLMPTYKDQWNFGNDMTKQQFVQDAQTARNNANIKAQADRQMAQIKAQYALKQVEIAAQANLPAAQMQSKLAFAVEAMKEMGVDPTTQKGIIASILGGASGAKASGTNSVKDTRYATNSGYAKDGTSFARTIYNADGTPQLDENGEPNQVMVYDKATTNAMRKANQAMSEAEGMVEAFKQHKGDTAYLENMNSKIEEAQKAYQAIPEDLVPQQFMDRYRARHEQLVNTAASLYNSVMG